MKLLKITIIVNLLCTQHVFKTMKKSKKRRKKNNTKSNCPLVASKDDCQRFMQKHSTGALKLQAKQLTLKDTYACTHKVRDHQFSWVSIVYKSLLNVTM
ncbi:CLUMA_CG011238, isoform A [Clunio marinus]|uniref:CLUMA_CG011238, isoform A n=1 Tax=Clunio marinus TaxID=568069 RepID=A0A1J1IC49_9DIPT|nr:CLUMA_CG011238, isoform A [Clunio marinus]